VSFSTSGEAKHFLVSRIVQEAKRRHVSLSDLERKMLYFSESYPSLSDMAEIAKRFENECDDEEYEERIRRLSKSAYRRDRAESPVVARMWREAVDVLKKEDHYILVMIELPRSARDVGKLVFTALVVIGFGFAAFLGLDWIRRHVLVTIPYSVQLVAFIVVLVLFCFLGWSGKAGKKAQRLFEWVVQRVIR
jgi:hypothetical protein